MVHPCEKKWIQTHREQVKESNRKSLRKWQVNHPEKRIASHNANRDYPISSHCVQCGSTVNLERHHPDYSKPRFVVTLCRKCHLGVHGDKK